jgi:hypothetical protein
MSLVQCVLGLHLNIRLTDKIDMQGMLVCFIFWAEQASGKHCYLFYTNCFKLQMKNCYIDVLLQNLPFLMQFQLFLDVTRGGYEIMLIIFW